MMNTTKRAKVSALHESSLESGVKICSALDMRYNGAAKIPIVIRITYQRERYMYATGAKVTIEEYDKILRSSGTKGEIAQLKRNIQVIFEKVKSKAEELIRANQFSIAALKEELKPKVKNITAGPTLFQLWQDFANSKSLNTANQYKGACVSFFESRGCTSERIILPDGKKSRKTELSGKSLKMKPVELTKSAINEWVEAMSQKGNSDTTIAMNLRAAKALLNHMVEIGVINALPKFKIKTGGKRDEDILPVRDILRIMAYDGEYKAMADWWMIVYLMNGANVRDLSEIRYTNSYEYDNTLSFIRHKTRGKSPSKVVIPVIPELQSLLDKYAAPYQPGKLVFPDICGTAVTEVQKLERVQRHCAHIREGMAEVCKSLKIRPATVNTARHTFATVLKAHGIPTDFIDIAMGHSRKEISSFYVTMFAEQRQKINSLLLQEPKGLPTMNY